MKKSNLVLNLSCYNQTIGWNRIVNIATDGKKNLSVNIKIDDVGNLKSNFEVSVYNEKKDETTTKLLENNQSLIEAIIVYNKI
jgi:hypothetical protein